jgi:tetratricopeptide (TPR) repeat protein
MSLVDAHGLTELAASRFSIHPVVRAFASRKLAELPVFEAQARSGWYGYFLRYVENYGDDDLGESIGRGIEGHREKLDAEMINLRATIEWCFQHRPEKAVRLVERITTYLLDEGLWNDRLELSQRAYEIARAHEIRESQVGLLVRLGWTELVKGEWDKAEKTYRQAIALAWEYKIHDRLVQALRDLGHLFALRGNFTRENGLDEAIELFAEAERLIAESLTLAEEIGDKLGTFEARIFAARVAYMRGDWAHLQKAQREFRLLLGQAFRLWRHVLPIHRHLAYIAIKEGDLAQAQRYLRNSDETLKKCYYEAQEETLNTECQGDLETAQEDRDQARATFKKALDLTIRLGMKKEETRIRRKLHRLNIGQ